MPTLFPSLSTQAGQVHAGATARTAPYGFEDLSNIIRRWRPAETPVLAMLPTGKTLENINDHRWTVDYWPTPKGAVGVPDGVPISVEEINNNAANQRQMGNIPQAFRIAFGQGWQQAQAKLPGKGNSMAAAAADQLILLKQQMECAITSVDQQASASTSSAGSIMAGMGALSDPSNTYDATLASTPLTVGKIPSTVAPPADFNVSVPLADLNYALFRTLMLRMRKVTKQKMDHTLLCGLDLREAITNQLIAPTASAYGSNGVVAQPWTFNRDMASKELGVQLITITGDFGRLGIIDTDWICKTTVDSNGAVTATRADRVAYQMESYGYIFQPSNYSLRWSVRPNTGELADNGAGEYKFIQSFCGLEVNHPQGTARLFCTN